MAAAGLAGLAILAVVAANLLGGASGSPRGSNDNEGTGGAGGSGDGETRTMAASQDARVAVSGDYRAGAGADSTLPVGAARGRNGVFLYRSLIQFEDDWTGTTRIQRIQLRLTRSGAVRASRGSSPSTRVMRNTAGRWSEGGGAELSSSNEVTWVNKPETTAEGSVTFEGPRKSGEEVLVDITDLYLPLAPEELGGQAVDNFGITLLAASDDGSPDGDGSVDGDQTNEFQSSDSRNGAPELVVTYEPE
ncbi:MAG: DNRLRE domain-containing protein [Chloroflexi bacterium]|nr:DNRLRE domain-containing protein [Chloroflexota bacterium]